jgi:hypothetical protein
VEAVSSAVRLMAAYPHLWAICGGWAVDLFLGRKTRSHQDVDLAILRRDQLPAQQYLRERGWTLEVAHHGSLIPWKPGEYLELPLHTIWCSRQDEFVELLLNETEGQRFLFRRDTTLQMSLTDVFLRTAEGIPFLAPEIVLLYKSNAPEHEGNRSDFFNALPALTNQQRRWLWNALAKLYPKHEWLDVLYNWIQG